MLSEMRPRIVGENALEIESNPSREFYAAGCLAGLLIALAAIEYDCP